MHWVEHTVDSRFPIMMSAMPRQVRARVSFAVTPFLQNTPRGGEWVGGKCGARIANTAGYAEPQLRRKNVLKIVLPAGLQVCDVLPLVRILLNQFVWNQKTHDVVG